MEHKDEDLARAKRKSRRQRRRKIKSFFRIFLLLLAAASLGVILFHTVFHAKAAPKGATADGPNFLQDAVVPDWVDVQIVPINEGGGRRGVALEDINNIVIHYVGNPGTTAQQNHDYFAQPATSVSSHFLVGLDGEVIQCIPLHEKSSASNHRNRDTISIETCHPDESGKFSKATYDRLVELTAWLCKLCDFDSSHVIRHYDVTGKCCPKSFVDHEDAWMQFLEDVQSTIDQTK